MKKVEPEPVEEKKVHEPASSCDMKKVEPAPEEEKKGHEPASSCDVKKVEPEPVEDKKVVEPASSCDVKKVEPEPVENKKQNKIFRDRGAPRKMHDGRDDPLCEQLTHGQPTSSAAECLQSAAAALCHQNSSVGSHDISWVFGLARENRDGSGSSGPRSKTTDSSSWSWQWEEPPKEEEEVQA